MEKFVITVIISASECVEKYHKTHDNTVLTFRANSIEERNRNIAHWFANGVTNAVAEDGEDVIYYYPPHRIACIRVSQPATKEE